jgi:two-component system, chemotaxis family, CheB/CheR fusion protein
MNSKKKASKTTVTAPTTPIATPEKDLPSNVGEATIEKRGEVVGAEDGREKEVSEEDVGFPVVGIGASAGGLAAFEAFFSGMPTHVEPGMAFVLVQHLAPDHKSILTELVRRYTQMQVFEVEDGMVVRPNCAYIIPPNRDMAFMNGALHLLERKAPNAKRLPIDFFFRSLAQDQHERAVCIVLSGTGSDGALGVRAIKGQGGMVMVQATSTTEYDGMPRAALATGMVDYELPPSEMAAQLIAYMGRALRKPYRTSDVGNLRKIEPALQKIFLLLRAQTGHDFSHYKPNTINRRIQRRMAVHQIEHLTTYIKYLQQTPNEVDALFHDLLIGVTNFFRDPEVFQMIEEQIVPKLFANKYSDSESHVIRIWSVGCSTGEEAYSLAILLAEYQEKMKRSYKVQIFATDIDSHAISKARSGCYPASIAADVSEERLARFFSPEPGEKGTAPEVYHINKNIRDMLIFSEQNVIKDPPFSKLDLLCCRNLLIYLDGELQKKMIPLFHYALKPGGYLLLGNSESIGDFGNLFTTEDRKAKLYQRKEEPYGTQRLALGRFFPSLPRTGFQPAQTTNKTKVYEKVQARELTEQVLLRHVVPPAVLVDRVGDILYIHGRTGQFLEPASGEVGVNNILKMAREGLEHDLAMTLHRASVSNNVERCAGVRVKTNGSFSVTNLTIYPMIGSSAVPLFLVTLETTPDDHRAELSSENTSDNALARIAALQQELSAKDEYIQATNEELETSNEELKSSNEEMQSVNEELQSTNEELETSKEELQSVNEELATVNAELQTKVSDLTRANNDMNNLLAGTGIGTVFVDHQLRILRFTPAVTKIINLIQSDIGRPVDHIVSNLLDYNELSSVIQEVLNSLVPKESEVQTKAGVWYNMRIQPYRTVDNVIEGAVLTFVDIGPTKMTQEALKQNEALFRTLAEVSPMGVFQADANGVFVYTNASWRRLFGLEQGGTTNEGWDRNIHPKDRPMVLDKWSEFIKNSAPLDVEFRIQLANDIQRWLHVQATSVNITNLTQKTHVGTVEDITLRKVNPSELPTVTFWKSAGNKCSLDEPIVLSPAH